MKTTKDIIIKASILGISTGIFFSLVRCISYAQQARTLTIVPPTVNQTLDAGGKSEGTMKVINDSDNAITMHIESEDFIVNDTMGTPQLLPPNTLAGKYSASSWIGVSPDSFTIPAHNQQLLNYFIQIPKNAGAGGHYAAIVFKPLNTSTLQSSGASIQTEIGTLFYLKVNGIVNEFAQVSSMKANEFQEYGPVTIITQIKNFGDIHISPSGAIKISDFLGRNIATLSLDKHNIFPGAARDYTNVLSNHFLIGRFKASLIASYGINGNLPLTSSIYFWVFPWKITLIIILVAMTLILGFLTIKAKKKAAEVSGIDSSEKNNP